MALKDNDVERAVARLLAATPTFYLSTAGDNGPWGAGAFFAERSPFDIGLILEQHGTTLRNIRTNSEVALVVSTGNPFEAFLQGAAVAEVLDEVDGVVADLRAKAPQIEPLLGAPIVAVRLQVTRWRVTDIPNGWLPGRELLAPERAAVPNPV